MNNPFYGQEAPITAHATMDYDKIKTSVIKDTYDYSNSLEYDAEASFSGWGVEAKAKMASESKTQLQADEVRFFASRVIKLGKKGWD